MKGLSFWDTNLFIYWLENSGPWKDPMTKLREWHRENELTILTSSLTLAELLVHPLRKKQDNLADEYYNLITQMECLPFGPREAKIFAQIRAAYPTVKPPDAIQLACAAARKVEYFITNDQRLSEVQILGVKTIRTLKTDTF